MWIGKKTGEEDEDGLYLAETCDYICEESVCAGLQLVILWLINFTIWTK